MARVVPVGPIDPELYAFAKKEAEKAERNPGYVPKKRETPAHTVFYRRVGATVKAFVIDKIAPITFPSPGSAIPIRPNFLHLHSELPEKVYGRANLAMSNSREYCDLDSPLGNSSSAYTDVKYSPFIAKTLLMEHVETTNANAYGRPNRAIQYAHRNSVLRNAILANWHAEDGEFSRRLAPWVDEDGNRQLRIDTDANNDGTVINTHRDAFSRTQGHTVQSHHASGGSELEFVRHSSFTETVTVDVSGVFLAADIRGARTDEGYITTQKSAMRSTASANMSAASAYDTNAASAYATNTTGRAEVNSDVVQFGLHTTACSFSGAVMFPAILNKLSATAYIGFHPEGLNYDIQLSLGIFKNLDDKVICKEDVSVTRSVVGYELPAERDAAVPRRSYAYIPCSTESEFPGVMVWVTALSPELQPILYGAEDNIVKAGMVDMFSMRGGDNRGAPSLLPRILTDGICTRYAWFFVNRYYEYSEPSRDVSNKISVVVFPDGSDNWHDIESLTVHSVELMKRPPRYVVAPGESIFISLADYHSEYVPTSPYTINGIVEEKGSDGKPTGMYLAGDGTISGILSDDGATFDISPRQPPGVPRVVDVEVQTERTHPARARFEVVSATPCAASMTIELANQGAILAGQSAVFYLTVTGFADGARIPYEITLGDQKVTDSTVEVVGGVSVIRFTSLVTVSYIEYYVYRLLNPYNTDASTNNFKISIQHQAAPPPLSFSVLYGTTTHQTYSDRPETPKFSLPYINAEVVRDIRGGDKERWIISSRHGVLGRVWYSIKTKRVYVTFWDGKSCEVSNILKKNPESGKYEFNPDWKEVPFDYPPAVDPYEIKGTLEPYVYAYMDYEASLTGE